MLAKVWKKLGFFILIIACLFNIMNKLVSKVSFDTQIKATAAYFQSLMPEKSTEAEQNANSQVVQNYTNTQTNGYTNNNYNGYQSNSTYNITSTYTQSSSSY